MVSRVATKVTRWPPASMPVPKIGGVGVVGPVILRVIGVCVCGVGAASVCVFLLVVSPAGLVACCGSDAVASEGVDIEVVDACCSC